MKAIFKTAVAAIALSFSTTALEARDLIVGLTPYAASPEEARTQSVRLLQFLTAEVQPGERARVIDAWRTTSICEFAVPDKPAYRNEKAKLTVNAPCVAALMKRAENAAQSSPVPYAVKLPDFLRFVGENFPAQAETDVLIVGSPLFDDSREPSTSMAFGHVPGDGHLNAANGVSPYSARNSSLLANRRIHLLAPAANWAINREHEYQVRRLWTLFAEKQGGSLVSFASDPETVYGRIRSGAESPTHDFRLASATKLEMIPVRRDSAGRTPIHQRALAQTPPAATELRAASNLEIGITWDCVRCDVDLYARPWRGAEVLHWNHTNTAEGQFFKDFQTSPESSNGLETIEFIVPVDLDKLFVALNLYEGVPPGGVIRGELRIALGDRTWAAPFTLETSSGNRGAGGSELFAVNGPSRPGWLVIDPRLVVGASQ